MIDNSQIIHTTVASVTLWTGVIKLKSIISVSPLVGTLTLSGLKDTSGAARNLVFPIGSIGAMLPTDANLNISNAAVTLSSASDADKVVCTWEVIR